MTREKKLRDSIKKNGTSDANNFCPHCKKDIGDQAMTPFGPLDGGMAYRVDCPYCGIKMIVLDHM